MQASPITFPCRQPPARRLHSQPRRPALGRARRGRVGGLGSSQPVAAWAGSARSLPDYIRAVGLPLPASRRWMGARLQSAIQPIYTLGGRMYMLCVNIFTGFLDFSRGEIPPIEGPGTAGNGFGGRSYHFDPLPTTFYHLSFGWPFPPPRRSITFGPVGSRLDYIAASPSTRGGGGRNPGRCGTGRT